jgi:hypothetical protein
VERALVSLLALAALAAPAAAETVYKSVDEQGNVTYSGEPPPAGEAERVQELRVGDGPTEEEQAEALRRMQEMEATAERLEQQRQMEETAESAATTAARQELEEARAALAEAREQRFEDWQYIAGGGRTLRPSYFQRVEQAEQRLQAAEQALRELR